MSSPYVTAALSVALVVFTAWVVWLETRDTSEPQRPAVRPTIRLIRNDRPYNWQEDEPA